MSKDHDTFDKAELEKQMYEKNAQELLGGDGLSKLFIFNLENFAYRYLETSIDKDIKCLNRDNVYWVESVEPSIIEALKWTNPKVKSLLIELCKKYPGAKSQDIKVKLSLGTEYVSEKKINCFASINWDFPNFEDTNLGVSASKEFIFEDVMELRNRHAAILESVAEIFS